MGLSLRAKLTAGATVQKAGWDEGAHKRGQQQAQHQPADSQNQVAAGQGVKGRGWRRDGRARPDRERSG